MHAMSWACVTCVGGQFWPERLWTWLSGKTLLFCLKLGFSVFCTSSIPSLGNPDVPKCQRGHLVCVGGRHWTWYVALQRLPTYKCKYKNIQIQRRRNTNAKIQKYKIHCRAICAGGCGWRERLDVECGLGPGLRGPYTRPGPAAQGCRDLIQGWRTIYTILHPRGLGSDGQMRNRRRIGIPTKRFWRGRRCHLLPLTYFCHWHISDLSSTAFMSNY